MNEKINIKIETLTPVHVGSGDVLQYNYDYVLAKEDDSNYVYILSMKSIVKMLQEKNIDINLWTECLTKGENVKSFLQRYNPNYNIQDYAERMIYVPDDQSGNARELRENIHDGFGRPYIPGSSIKGAIRTAIIANELKYNKRLEDKFQDRNGKYQIKDSAFLNDIFGKDITKNPMKCLQVGDAYFEQEGMDALNMINLNQRQSNGYIDESKQQYLEAITIGEESTFSIKYSPKSPLPRPFTNIKNIEDLFSVVNTHTKELLEQEIEIWKGYEEKEGVENYILACEQILEHFPTDNKSCVLRLGHGNGWRFITGAWTEKVENKTWNAIVNTARSKNKDKYSEYMFPKSRRINVIENDDNIDVCLLGFVKLSIIN